MPDEAFWTIHDGLPRQGPGDRGSTLRALALMTQLPAARGYREIGHFVLPPSAWWDDYYRPLEARLAPLRAEHGRDPPFRARLDETQAEIDAWREHAGAYGYVFFVMRAI